MMETANRLVAKKRAKFRKQGGGRGAVNGVNGRGGDDTNHAGETGTGGGEGCGGGSAVAYALVGAGGVCGVTTMAVGGGDAGGNEATTCIGSDASPPIHDAPAWANVRKGIDSLTRRWSLLLCSLDAWTLRIYLKY